ncbi:hypothetical protein KPH14_000868 [Odynerus spinipes]|uniref:Uncharacterized protein n=1 Tax=Odynerus spinipes TaxID=1348599 RepID=A0AAD9REC4_9HYME|nr:hypothetical protein KPH14_000868 [Odynerus spinipes]
MNINWPLPKGGGDITRQELRLLLPSRYERVTKRRSGEANENCSWPVRVSNTTHAPTLLKVGGRGRDPQDGGEGYHGGRQILLGDLRDASNDEVRRMFSGLVAGEAGVDSGKLPSIAGNSLLDCFQSRRATTGGSLQGGDSGGDRAAIGSSPRSGRGEFFGGEAAAAYECGGVAVSGAISGGGAAVDVADGEARDGARAVCAGLTGTLRDSGREGALWPSPLDTFSVSPEHGTKAPEELATRWSGMQPG